MKKAVLPFLMILIAMSAQQLSAQNKIMGVGQLGLGVPMSDFSDRHGVGFMLMGQGRYQLEPKLWLTGALGYQRFGLKEEGTSSSTKKYEGGVSLIPIAVGGLLEVGEGNLIPYISAELGMFFMSYNIKTTEYGIPKSDVSDSRNDFGLIPGVGILYPINDKLKLDVSLKYYWIFGDYMSDVVDITYFGIQAGVQFPLN
jgi:hypothetical protein